MARRGARFLRVEPPDRRELTVEGGDSTECPGHRPPGDARRRDGRYGHWRAVAAAPALLGSLLVWAAGAAVLMTRVGERMTVRTLCRFHRPSPGQVAACNRHGRRPYD